MDSESRTDGSWGAADDYILGVDFIGRQLCHCWRSTMKQSAHRIRVQLTFMCGPGVRLGAPRDTARPLMDAANDYFG